MRTPAICQGPDPAIPSKWTRIVLGGGEISIAVPRGYLVDAEKRAFGQKLKVYAFENGVEMEISVADGGEAHDRFNNSFGYGAQSTVQVEKDGFRIKRRSASQSEGSFNEFTTLASKKRVYEFNVRSRQKESPVITRFMFSVKLGDKPLFTLKEPLTWNEETIDQAALKTSPEIAEAWDRDIEVSKEHVKFDPKIADMPLLDSAGFSRPLIIVHRPFASLPRGKRTRENNTSAGSGRLLVEYRADGSIGVISSDTPLDVDYVNSFVETARKTRFVPAQINGANVDVIDVYPYSFFTITTSFPPGS